MGCSVLHADPRGVITLIHNSLPFRLINVDEDRFGRYLVIQCEIILGRLNLVNLYGLNDDNPSFFINLFLSMADLPGSFIIGGHFNCALRRPVDLQGQIPPIPRQERNCCNFLESKKLPRSHIMYCLLLEVRHTLCHSTMVEGNDLLFLL